MSLFFLPLLSSPAAGGAFVDTGSSFDLNCKIYLFSVIMFQHNNVADSIQDLNNAEGKIENECDMCTVWGSEVNYLKRKLSEKGLKANNKKLKGQ